MRLSILIFITALAAISFGCFGGETNLNSNSPVNSAVQPENAAAANTGVNDDSAIKMEEIYPVASYSYKTPTEAMETYIKATVNMDIPEIRKSLSQESLKMVEDSARDQNKTVGELLTGGAVANESKKIPQFKNEKITGDAATVEYKDEIMPEFVMMYLIKEDGQWKIDLKKFMDEVIKKATEAMSQPAPNAGNVRK